MANITTELVKHKKDTKESQDQAVKQVLLLEQGDAQEDLRIANALGKNHSISRAQTEMGKKLELETLDGKYAGNVYTLKQIKGLAKKYNMRFLPSKHFCGNLDTEVIAKLKAFSRETNTEITDGALQHNFYILAPESCFVLQENIVINERKPVDPALFYKIDDDHYRLVHQWGSDFNLWNRYQGFKHSDRSNYVWANLLEYVLIAAVILLPAFYFFGSRWYTWVALGVAVILGGVLVSGCSDPKDTLSDTFHDGKWRSQVKTTVINQ